MAGDDDRGRAGQRLRGSGCPWQPAPRCRGGLVDIPAATRAGHPRPTRACGSRCARSACRPGRSAHRRTGRGGAARSPARAPRTAARSRSPDPCAAGGTSGWWRRTGPGAPTGSGRRRRSGRGRRTRTRWTGARAVSGAGAVLRGISPAICRSLSLFMGAVVPWRKGEQRGRVPRRRGAGEGTAAGSEGTRRGRSGWAQQPGQQQLQRARAAPRNPAVQLEVSAKFASMPTRTPVHTCTVNSATGSWDVVHLIRSI
ncbi:hypothetical protein SGLAM104S_01990 [Streptomyces glaucescens]